MHVAVAAPPAARAIPPWREPNLDPAPDEPEAGWPLLATPVPAGFPAPADDAVERSLSLDDHLIRHPESTFFVRVSGDALAVEGLHDGDLLVVDRAGPPTAGSLVVAVVGGRFALRRLGRDASGRPRLESADAASGDGLRADAPPDGATFELWGVVRWAVHRLWPAREPRP